MGKKIYRKKGGDGREYVAEITNDGRITVPDGMFTHKTVGWLVDDSPLPSPPLDLTDPDPDLPWAPILLLALFGAILFYGALQLAWGSSSLGAFSGKDVGMLIIGLTAVATCAVSSLVIFRRVRHGEVSGIAAIAQTVAEAYCFPVGGVTVFFVIGTVMGREPLMVLLIPISIVPYMVALCLPFFVVETLVLWIISRCVRA